MAPRSSWRGYLRLSLVTCPVAMLPATSEAEKVRFHTLNRATGNRVHARYVDAETGKPVEDEDQVRQRADGTRRRMRDHRGLLSELKVAGPSMLGIGCPDRHPFPFMRSPPP